MRLSFSDYVIFVSMEWTLDNCRLCSIKCQLQMLRFSAHPLRGYVLGLIIGVLVMGFKNSSNSLELLHGNGMKGQFELIKSSRIIGSQGCGCRVASSARNCWVSLVPDWKESNAFATVGLVKKSLGL